MPTIDPSFLTTGPEFQIEAPALEQAPGTADGGEGFGGVLGKQLDSLSQLQTESAEASQALATGTATDPASVVMSVERARLSMQLASQLRTKGVEAINEVFRTQV